MYAEKLHPCKTLVCAIQYNPLNVCRGLLKWLNPHRKMWEHFCFLHGFLKLCSKMVHRTYKLKVNSCRKSCFHHWERYSDCMQNSYKLKFIHHSKSFNWILKEQIVQKIGIMSDDKMMNTRVCGMENGQHLTPEIWNWCTWWERQQKLEVSSLHSVIVWSSCVYQPTCNHCTAVEWSNQNRKI